jgi:hypothetical protein
MENIKTTRQNQEEITDWKNFKDNSIWKKIVLEMKNKIEKADLVINELGGDKELEFSKRDLAILKKNSYLDLIEYPDEMIELLSGTGVEQIEEMDPFIDEPNNEDFEDEI